MTLINALLNMDWYQVGLLTLQHLLLVGAAVLLAIIVGVPLSILCVRVRWLAVPIMSIATMMITLPAIALFGIMMPFYARYGMGLGAAPAISAVFIYSLLPIIRNTYLALQGVDDSIKEAGRGIGMTYWQRLFMVDIPIAVPSIMSGIRTAVVMDIGTMTIAPIIGAGGLGLLITNAIGQSNKVQIFIAAIIVTLLAIIVDVLLHQVQNLLTSKGIRA